MKKKKLLTLRNGYWSKMVKGKVYYFGKDYRAAVSRYNAERSFLELGVKPNVQEGYTVGDLINAFLSDRKERMDVGTLSPKTYKGYDSVADKILDSLDKDIPLESLVSEHFELLRKDLSRGVGPKSLDGYLTCARTMFKFAATDNYLIDRPLPYSKALAGVPARELRKYRSTRPDRRLEPEHIKDLLEHCSPNMKAMVLLGINGGYNNSDVGQLRMEDINDGDIPDILDYYRRKTYIRRVTPLWPETKTAIKQALEERPRCSSEFVFVMITLNSYHQPEVYDPIGMYFTRAIKKTPYFRRGRNFGALRTTFANVGLEVGDDLAVKSLMGHLDASTLYTHYAAKVYVPRLQRVTDHVHDWLFG